MIDGKNIFDQPVKNNKVTYENFTDIATSKGDGYTAGYLLDWLFVRLVICYLLFVYIENY